MKQTVILLAASLLFAGVLTAQTPKLIVPTGFNNSIVTKMLVSPDGKILYTLTVNYVAKCFDALSGIELRTYEGGGQAMDMLLSPNGKLLVLLGSTATTYDAATGLILGQAKPISGMNNHSYYYGCFLDNENFCTATIDGTLFFNQKNWSIPANNIPLANYYHIAISPDGKSLAAVRIRGGYYKLDIWNLAAGSSAKSVLLGKVSPKYSLLFDQTLDRQIMEVMAFSGDSKALNCIFSSRYEKHDIYTSKIIDPKTSKTLVEYASGRDRPMLITTDGKVLMAASNGLEAREIKDGKKIWQTAGFYKSPPPALSFVAETIYNNITVSGNEVYYFMQDGEVARAGLNDGIMQKKIGAGKIYQGSYMALSADKRWLAISKSDSRVAIWDLKYGKLIGSVGEVENKNLIIKLSFSADGGKLMIVKDLRPINFVEIIETKTGKTLSKIQSSHGFSGAISPSGDYFFYDYNGVSVFNSSDGKIVHTQPAKLPTVGGQFSTDGKYILYIDSNLVRLEMDTWVKKNIPGERLTSYLSNTTDGKTLAIGGTETVSLVGIDGRPIRKIKLSTNTFTSDTSFRFLLPSFSISGQKLAVADTYAGDIAVYDASSTKELINFKKAHTKTITGIEFLNENIFISGADDNRFKLWSINGKLQGEFFVLGDNDWVFATNDGRFDGSPEAIKKLYYVQGFQTISMDNLYEKFYTPNLLARILENDALPVPDVDITKLAAPPKVKMTFDVARNLVVGDDVAQLNWTNETISVKVNAECTENAIDEIRLYLNGKILDGSNRNLVVEDDKNEKSLSKTFTIKLAPGINSFKAIALNKQRTESKPDETDVNYIPAKNDQVPIAANNITLHLLVIGINNYKNPKYNLNYAKADATSFKEEMEQNTSSIFNKTKMYFITDAEAMKANIEATFNKIVTEAKPQDIFVFYYAGHGVMSDDGKKEFYIVPYDVTQLYGAEDALAQKGISAKELQEFSTKIPAQKQLYILDACQSAGALDAVAMRGAAEEKAIAQLARSTGTHWLTASGTEQFATEFSQLGHGVFTYALLQGLLGGADNGDKQITINELKAYLEIQVPELSQKYKGAAQYPSSYGFGNDFPLMIIK